MNKVNDDKFNNEEDGIAVESKSNTSDTKVQIEEETEISNNLEQKDHKKDYPNNVNPLFYEIGPFPREPPTVIIQYIGSRRGGGDPLEYDSSRNNFVRLVFGLVLIMMLCTAGFCFFANHVTPVKRIFMNKKIALFLIIFGCGVTTAISYAFACSACTRDAPCSYICLGIAVLGYSVICAYFTVRYDTQVILLAVVATTVVVIVCLALACTSFDFTKFLLIVIVAICAFCAISLTYFIYTVITGHYMKLFHVILLFVGTLLHSICLIIELQMILGGKSVELSEDDYAYAAFSVYTSIIALFLNLMQLLNMDFSDLF